MSSGDGITNQSALRSRLKLFDLMVVFLKKKSGERKNATFLLVKFWNLYTSGGCAYVKKNTLRP